MERKETQSSPHSLNATYFIRSLSFLNSLIPSVHFHFQTQNIILSTPRLFSSFTHLVGHKRVDERNYFSLSLQLSLQLQETNFYRITFLLICSEASKHATNVTGGGRQMWSLWGKELKHQIASNAL